MYARDIHYFIVSACIVDSDIKWPSPDPVIQIEEPTTYRRRPCRRLISTVAADYDLDILDGFTITTHHAVVKQDKDWVDGVIVVLESVAELDVTLSSNAFSLHGVHEVVLIPNAVCARAVHSPVVELIASVNHYLFYVTWIRRVKHRYELDRLCIHVKLTPGLCLRYQ